MTSIKYTHYGWFGFCPIYLKDIDSFEPHVDVRHWVFHPLFWASLFMYKTIGLFMDDPMFPLMIMGELKHEEDKP